MGKVLNSADSCIIKDFQGSRDNLCRNNARHCLACIINGIKHGNHALGGLRSWQQLQKSLGDNAQGSLRAGKELGHVVAGHVLYILAAGVDNIAIGQDNFQSLHIVLGDAVLQAPQAAGIFRNSASQACRLYRARIRRINQAILSNMVIDVLHNDTYLHLGNQIFQIHIDNLVEAEHQQHNTALQRSSTGRQIGTGATRIHRNLMGISILHNL